MAHGTQENTFLYLLVYYKGYRASLVAQLVKNPRAMRETWIQSLGWEDALEKQTATHSSILAWRIPMDCSPPGSSVHGDGFSRQEYWSGLPCPPPGDLPNPGMEPRSPALQVDSLPAEPQGKPKNTGVGSLSLLQGICSTPGWNPGLPHCRWILTS